MAKYRTEELVNRLPEGAVLTILWLDSVSDVVKRLRVPVHSLATALLAYYSGRFAADRHEDEVSRRDGRSQGVDVIDDLCANRAVVVEPVD